MLSACAREVSELPASPFQVLLKPDLLMRQPVALYTVRGSTQPVVSAPCEALEDSTWACSFPAAPVAAAGDLRLLLGDSDPTCGLPVSEGGVFCPWPVTFENPSALTGVEARSTLELLAPEKQPPLEALPLNWAGSGLDAEGLRLTLQEPLSGLWLSGFTDENGLLTPSEGCALWESSGCMLPGALEWHVQAQLDTGLDLELMPTQWSALSPSPLEVTCPDQDNDGFPLADCGVLPADCADHNPAIFPGASEDPQDTGLGDGLDNDCDQLVDEGTAAGDDDHDGYSELAGDCDDSNPSRNPSATEIYGDGIDQNCDGIDKLDEDGDGFFSTTTGGDDCDDTRAEIHPGAMDLLNDGLDSNCNGVQDLLQRLAGTGTYNGEGLAAHKTSLGQLYGIAADSDGKIYLAEYHGHRIRKLTPEFQIYTVVGDGIGRFNGDGAALSKSIANPTQLFAAPDGELLIVDTFNRRIRLYKKDGTLSTLIGNGTYGVGEDGEAALDTRMQGLFGVAVDGLGRVCYSEPDLHRVRCVQGDGTVVTVAGVAGVSGDSGDNGPATSALLNTPMGLGRSSTGSLLIADAGNHRVRKIALDGNMYRVAGLTQGFSGDGGPAGDAKLSKPVGVLGLSDGRIFIADYGNARVRMVDTSFNISTVAGNGSSGISDTEGELATKASIGLPMAITQSSSGEFFLISDDSKLAQRFTLGGPIYHDIGNGGEGYHGDTGPALDAQVGSPLDLAVSLAGEPYFSDQPNCAIRRVNTDGIIETVVGGRYGFSGDGGAATDAALRQPAGIFMDDEDALWIADTYNHRIRWVNAAGIIETRVGNGTAGYSGDGGPALSASLNEPTDVAVDEERNIYIVDKRNHCVRKVIPFENGCKQCIQTFAGVCDPVGQGGFSGDGGLATDAELSYPRAVLLGQEGEVYISDTNNSRIRVVSADGVIQTFAGNGGYGLAGDGGLAVNATMYMPGFMAQDGAGNLYFAQYARVRRVHPDGIIEAVAGIGYSGDGAEGGPALSAGLTMPLGLAIDPLGVLYLTDPTHLRVLKVTP
ncbi:MAG: MopE-related protein [Myxococcota bacterium]